jgi:N-formylglutamate amidohydrolase
MRVLCVTLLWVAAVCGQAGDYEPGGAVFGQGQFIEYVPGDLPLILAAPHGGRLTPGEIPDRTSGVRDIDANTQELARTIAAAVQERTGKHIHLVICRLHRSKLDANRDLPEAAQGSTLAEQAWREHHDFIEQACTAAVKQFGVAFLIDLHGHGHADSRVELGYLHTAADLAESDEALNGPAYVKASSLRWMVEHGELRHTELLRGRQSLGALLEARGYPATPSPRMPVPTEPFFRGGYTVARHCDAANHVSGMQIEANRSRLRDTAENRLRFAQALAAALDDFFTMHLGFGLDGQKPMRTAIPVTRQSTLPVFQSSPKQ